jgi:hypothetical protein
VLPDVATGQNPGTLAAKLSRCKEGMARVFAFMQEFCGVRAASRYKLYRSREIITGYKTGSGHRSSIAVQTISEPEIYHGARIKLRATERVRMQGPLEICLDAGAKQKP